MCGIMRWEQERRKDRKIERERERERRNLVGPYGFERGMDEGGKGRGLRTAAIMHGKKCARGQTGQRNVMALLAYGGPAPNPYRLSIYPIRPTLPFLGNNLSTKNKFLSLQYFWKLYFNHSALHFSLFISILRGSWEFKFYGGKTEKTV